MPEVHAWAGTWQQGKFYALDEGNHNIGKIGSMVIPEGWMVTPQGGTALYAGTYDDLSWYDYQFNGDHSYKVETTDIDNLALMEIQWIGNFNGSTIKLNQTVPPGTYNAEKKYWPDAAIGCVLPPNSTCVIYGEGSEQGNAQTLDTEGYNSWSNMTVKSVKFELDGWTQISSSLGDGVFDDDASVDSQSAHANNESEFQATMTVTITDTVETETSQEWDTSASISTGVSAGTDIGPVEIEASIETEVGASYGQTSSDGQSTELSREVDVDVPPGGEAKITMQVTVGKATIPVTRQLQNDRTGEIITETGTITSNYASDTEISVEGGEMVQVRDENGNVLETPTAGS